MDDEQILDLYFARDEQALAETDRKYGGYCYSLANGILNSEQDAEETVSDTYLKAWNTIPPHRPTAPAFSSCFWRKLPAIWPFPDGGRIPRESGAEGKCNWYLTNWLTVFVPR